MKIYWENTLLAIQPNDSSLTPEIIRQILMENGYPAAKKAEYTLSNDGNEIKFSVPTVTLGLKLDED